MSTTSTSTLSYTQLLETNNLIQLSADETYWLCVTRTVQESKMFPVPAYMMYSYANAFFRYPELLRKIESAMPAEEVADRARHMAGKVGSLAVGWSMPGFYLLGRQLLLEYGLIRPTDALEDVAYIMDFWKRYQLSYHRNDGHLTNKEFGHRSQIHAERTIQVFAADMYDVEDGDELHVAATDFMSTASQYGFLISCESRISLHNEGPYRLADGRELMVRDFMDLAEGDFPWLDGVAADVPYNALTMVMGLKDTHVYLTDDWGSFESDPEFQAHHVSGVGLYTSDALTEGYIPVGMGSREELTATLRDLTEKLRVALEGLWKRVAGWSRDQMMDAGAIVYCSIFKDLAHVAGVYEMEDWMLIDERAHKFRALFNDEYSRDALVELCVGMMNNHRAGDHVLMQHSNDQSRLFTPIPYDVLNGGASTTTSGPIRAGDSVLPRKSNDRYRTSQGVLTAAEYNARARAFVPAGHADGRRFLCDTWVKYHAGTEAADELYRIEQESSRNLKGAGSALRGVDLLAAHEGRLVHRPPTADVLHALGVLKKGSVDRLAEILGTSVEPVTAELDQLVTLGHVAEIEGEYLLTPLARLAAIAQDGQVYADQRASASFLAAMENFERVNDELKTLISKWQTRDVAGQWIANDHSDPDYDDGVVADLGDLHDRAVDTLSLLALEVPRLDAYTKRLSTSLQKAESGETAWVSDVRISSYHTVWFELHEDLLTILGHERQE